MGEFDFHPLRVRQVQRDADDAVLVTFDIPAPLRERFCFSAGQHLTLRRGDLRRSYSICAAPGQPLRVGVRRVAGGAFSTALHADVKAGDTLDVMPPQGRFGAALAQRPRHVLAVAGGSGITPVLSIVAHLLASDAQAHCTLLYGNRSAASMMFKDELDDLKNRHLVRFALQAVFSREQVDSPLHGGRLDGARVTQFLRLAGAVDQAFVCGPHAMNDDVQAALLTAGVAPAGIHIERFGIPSDAAAPALQARLADEAPQAPTDDEAPQLRAGDVAAARVAIVRDGVTRELSFGPGDANILAAAARAGLDVPYSCRSGVCATCRARLLHGRVCMDRNFALEPAEVDAGFVLTCQARPLTARVVLSFDDR